MATRQTADGVAFECDACGEMWEPPKLGRGSAPRDFAESLELARKDGFHSVQVKSKIPGRKVWEHRCKEFI